MYITERERHGDYIKSATASGKRPALLELPRAFPASSQYLHTACLACFWNDICSVIGAIVARDGELAGFMSSSRLPRLARDGDLALRCSRDLLTITAECLFTHPRVSVRVHDVRARVPVWSGLGPERGR
jgi:hypothetical protein